MHFVCFAIEFAVVDTAEEAGLHAKALARARILGVVAAGSATNPTVVVRHGARGTADTHPTRTVNQPAERAIKRERPVLCGVRGIAGRHAQCLSAERRAAAVVAVMQDDVWDSLLANSVINQLPPCPRRPSRETILRYINM
eukprot:SAG11_NODE_551_length_8587_cov_6.916951_5_plen_141_part_00